MSCLKIHQRRILLLHPPHPPGGGPPPGSDKKLLAGLLGISIGSLEIHRFIVDCKKEGVLQIVISIVTCELGGIIGSIEGIIYLTTSNQEFVATYIQGKKSWFQPRPDSLPHSQWRC